MPPEKRVLLEPAGSGGKDRKRAGTCPEMASRPCKRSRLAGLEAPDVLIRIMELAAARERTGYGLLKILQAIEGVLRVTGGRASLKAPRFRCASISASPALRDSGPRPPVQTIGRIAAHIYCRFAVQVPSPNSPSETVPFMLSLSSTLPV
jgi:hypothetical protein